MWYTPVYVHDDVQLISISIHWVILVGASTVIQSPKTQSQQKLPSDPRNEKCVLLILRSTMWSPWYHDRRGTNTTMRRKHVDVWQLPEAVFLLFWNIELYWMKFIWSACIVFWFDYATRYIITAVVSLECLLFDNAPNHFFAQWSSSLYNFLSLLSRIAFYIHKCWDSI